MSEFFATAEVLVVPNAAAFAATLKAQLAAAIAEVGPVVVPVTAVPVTTGAATGALAEHAAAAGVDADAVKNLTAQEANLARATALQEQAETLLVGREEAAALVVGTLNKARSDLAITTTALTKAEQAADIAIGAGVPEIQASTAALVKNIEAQQVLAKVAVREAVAQHESAAAARESAAAHAQLARGVGAQSLQLAGLRGATLAASAPFIAGAAGVIVFAKAIKSASDETEELNKSTVIFGESADEVRKFAESSANSLGISTTQALKATGIFGNLFRVIHISQPVAADMSERLVKLASDLSSFNNADPSKTLEALRSGLVGQARPLRVFGIFLSAARVQQEALIETGKKSVKALTNSELVTARYNIILRDGAIANNDFANTSDRLANQSRALSANMENLSAQLGQQLVPALTLGVRGLNDLLGGTQQLIVGLRGLRGEIEHSHAFEGFNKDVEGGTSAVSRFFLKVRDGIPFLDDLKNKVQGIIPPEVTPSMKRLAEAAGGLGEASRDAAFGVGALVDSIGKLKEASSAAKALEFLQLKIETGLAPGGRSAEEANLKAQIEQDKRIFALTESGTKARRDALLQLKSDQDALGALQDKDTSDAQDRARKAKAAAAKRKAAAKEAARAQQDAAQAFIDAFAPKQQRLQNRLTTAQTFGTVQQQITINQAILVADKAEIAAIQKFIHNKHLHGDALKTALAAITTIKQDEFTTRLAIRQLNKPDPQALFDFQQSHLQAALSIAETTKSTRDDKRALKAIIDFDNARITALKKKRKKTLEEKTELDALRVDLAQRNKALKDLQGVTEDANKAAAKFFFSQLQAQQGFAGNLLGNLIGGSTAGLVGVPSPASAAKAAGAIPEDRVASERNRQQAKTTPGPTAGQHQTTNDILIRILHALTRQNRTDQAPEAHHQRRVGAAIMDNDGIHGI